MRCSFAGAVLVSLCIINRLMLSEVGTLAVRDVEKAVELICQKGCKSVWGDISTLEQGQSIPEADALSAGEISQVIDELKAIMAVYDGTCSPY